MKRKGYIIEKIAEMENLREAYLKARKGKRDKREVIRFTARLNKNLLQLRRSILSGEVEVGRYNYFKIYDPKERVICAASFAERVLHHAIMNVCHHDFDSSQTDDSYASRLGRGTYAALEKAYENQCRYKYCLKLDIRKYFDSVSHTVLKKMLARKYKDKVFLQILHAIIESYHTDPDCGLPIGNLTSQYFANHYLCGLDHYVRETLHAPGYVRYMDDMMLWDNDAARLKEIGVQMRNYIENVLRLRLKIFQLQSTRRFMTFLGYKIARNQKSLSSRSSVRYKRKLKRIYALYDGNILRQSEMNRLLQPLIAFVMKVPSLTVRRSALQACTI